MDELNKLLGFASKFSLPGLVGTGLSIAGQVRDYAAEVKATAARMPHVLTSADHAELDAIHAGALAAADELDAKLAAAEQR